MTYGMISGSEACFHLCPKLPNQSTRKSDPEIFSSLQLKTQLVKPIISIKTPTGLYRGGRTRAAAVNSLYAAAQENLYELLGVSERGTLSEIKKAYKKLALKYHPDVSPPHRAAEYTRRFIRVQEAYETLSDPNTRAMCDRDLGAGLQLGSSRRRRDQVALSLARFLSLTLSLSLTHTILY